MAIKWKKSHPGASFLYFLLAIHFGIAAIAAGITSCLYVGYDGSSGKLFTEGPAGSWQMTNMFHSNLSWILNSVLEEQVVDEFKEYRDFTPSETGYNMQISVKNVGEQVINTFQGPVPKSPEEVEPEFSYFLTFDGHKVRAYFEGKEQDIYGDNMYFPYNGWNVPGFASPSTYLEYEPEYRDKLKEINVVIAIRDIPVSYQIGYGYLEQSVYSSYHTFMVCKTVFWCSIAGLFLALILFVLYILRRKEKALVDRKISLFLGRVPLLIKACIFVFLLFLLFSLSAWLVVAYFLVWYFYLLFCDLRYNKKQFFRNTCLHRIANRMRRFQDRLPVQKRIITNSWLALASIILSSIFFVFLIISLGFQRYYGIQVICIFLWILFEAAVLIFFEKRKIRLANDLGVLLQAVTDVCEGKYENVPQEIPKGYQFEKALRELQSIQKGMQKALREEIEAVEAKVKNERMKMDLITNVSHDIRTPLTSIIGYVELLKEEDLPEHVKEYIHVLDEKSQRLRTMVQDVFDMSKATSGNMKLNMETLDFARLLRQTLAEMGDRIDESGFDIRISLPDAPVWIQSDGARLYRVLQNLLQNALQYSLEGSKIRVSMKENTDTAVLKIRNISREDLPEGADFTERFFRGDMTRNTEGSGLGLSIAKSFTEACGGSFAVETQEDIFICSVCFHLVSPPESAYPDISEEILSETPEMSRD